MAEQEIGCDVEYILAAEGDAERIAITKPASFDVYDHFFHSVDLVWAAGVIQPIDIRRLKQWDLVTGLTKLGCLTSTSREGAGEAPVTRLYVQADGGLDRRATSQISMLPLVHNVDSFGYFRESASALGFKPPESWAWFLDDRWKGHVSMVVNPTIGLMELALAAQAAGHMEFKDIGKLSLVEIDRLLDLLEKRTKASHFNSFWTVPAEAEAVIERKPTIISSLWSPSYMALRRKGLKIRSAVPVEGYRAWHGGISFSSRIAPDTLDLAYEYANFWLSGKPGAIISRDGHYVSAPEAARSHLTQDEWDYWYIGQPARVALNGSDGQPIVDKGEVRDGGSYAQRISNIAVWNSTMPEHNYIVRRWGNILKNVHIPTMR
ncbi:ABC transporter substrate-binding protein [Agrobacterium rosae]|uniref:ABC transporter substrate-binding protein n=1 Tax=Agrobacterium rosae TaxID=1972867 RepID=UPI0019D36C01|nr:ABC transporter substrate-binding protein [Agrobacterium rosae]MBN7809206.1 ABC transporter substrate-binding protein [Agrobacterium rosae]